MIRNLSKVNYDDVVVTLDYEFDGKKYEKDVNLIDKDLDEYFGVDIPGDLLRFVDVQEISEDENFIAFLHDKLEADIKGYFEDDREEQSSELEAYVEIEVDNNPENYRDYTEDDVKKLLEDGAKENYLDLVDIDALIEPILAYIKKVQA